VLTLQGSVSVSLDELRVGVTCSHPIEDDNGVLLLGSHTQITQFLIDGLRERGIESIEIDPRDLAAMRGKASKKAPTIRKERRSVGDWDPTTPMKSLLVDRYDEDLNEDRSQQLAKKMDQAKSQFAEVKEQLGRERIRSLGDLVFLSDDYAHAIVDDHDQTLGSLLRLGLSSDPDEQSVRMAVLGMAVATEMGFDPIQTLEVGMTGLLHDIGLHAMDAKFRRPLKSMSESELWEYRKHPLVSVLCLAEVAEIPQSVRLAMQQVHEQYDGSGYPRGIKGQRIHPYARILNVVDAYLQLTAPNSERCGVVPHDAMGLMLHQAGRGFFDPKAIRALLNVESLYPLGSLVELKSGDLAQVIRRPRSGFAAPVLLDLQGNRIELESSHIEVVRPVCDPTTDQMRLSPTVMQSTLWHPASHALPI
jgi:HD-GYP domain-containing protein (c-di-GMP phosphodiesterase class II)